jgi:Flp pilus assembly protein TadB
MMLSNPVYVKPLVSTPVGWVMLAGMAILMALGAITMSKLIKVEV